MAANRSEGLGFLDRLVIVVAWLASCGVVFIIGYYVGKDAVPPTVGMPPAVIEVPVSGEGPVGEDTADGGTFYESLGRQAPRENPTGVPVVPSRVPVGRPTTTVAAAPTTTVLRMPMTTTTAQTSATIRTKTTMPAAAVETTTTTTAVRPTTTVPARPTTTLPIRREAIPAGRGWTVYVSPTRDRFEAERQRTVLRAAGYDAVVVRVQRDGDEWYRVRAGRFPSEADAERARRDLRERGIGHAFVQSE